MKLEKLVPTLEECKALAQYWPKGKETAFIWTESSNGISLGLCENQDMDRVESYYPAPTLQEIWDFIPDEFTHEGDVYEKWLSWGGAFAYVVEGSNTKAFMCSAPHANPLTSLVNTILEHEAIQKQLK